MIGRIWRSLTGRAPAPGQTAAEPLPPAPEIDRLTYAVGDVHGRHDLLVPLFDRIAEDARAAGAPDARVVFLGDYVDRGEQSRQAVEWLLALRDGADGQVEILRGNHEEMLLDFLREPLEFGPMWLRNGGLQTLLSWGIGGLSLSSDGRVLEEAAEKLAEAMGPVAGRLAALPLSAVHGRVMFAHAAGDPERPVDLQDPTHLCWGAPQARRRPRTDGMWVVHGHWVVDEPDVAHGHVDVDTGAWFSGRLTAARLSPDGTLGFLST